MHEPMSFLNLWFYNPSQNPISDFYHLSSKLFTGKMLAGIFCINSVKRILSFINICNNSDQRIGKPSGKPENHIFAAYILFIYRMQA
jgi:hypothetical protein